MPGELRFPIRFREAELGRLFNAIIDGDSASFVGVGSVGKTHLLQHIAHQPNVQNYFLREVNQSALTSDNVLFVIVDANSALDMQAFNPGFSVAIPQNWAGFELFLRSLRDAVRRQGRFGADVTRILDDAYARLSMEGLAGAWRGGVLLQTAVDDLFEQVPSLQRIVFLLDEFEHLLDLPDSFFLNLRALRDRHRYHVLYVAAARQEVDKLSSGSRGLPLEPFTEIFRAKVFLGPVTEERDRRVVFDQLIARMKSPDFQLSEDAAERLAYITGGHVGLLRTCFGIHNALAIAASPQEAVLIALKRRSVVRECDILLASLSASEQAFLDSISLGERIAPDDFSRQMLLKELQAKHVVERHEGEIRVAPPLLQVYLAGRRAGLYQSTDY